MFSFKTSPEMMNPRYFALIQSRKAGKKQIIFALFSGHHKWAQNGTLPRLSWQGQWVMLGKTLQFEWLWNLSPYFVIYIKYKNPVREKIHIKTHIKIDHTVLLGQCVLLVGIFFPMEKKKRERRDIGVDCFQPWAF